MVVVVCELSIDPMRASCLLIGVVCLICVACGCSSLFVVCAARLIDVCVLVYVGMLGVAFFYMLLFVCFVVCLLIIVCGGALFVV